MLSAAVLATTAAAVIATRQRAIAEDQRNTAVANQLVNESRSVQDSQPGLARQLLAAAYRLKSTPQVTGALAAGAAIPQELRVAADRFAFRADGQVLATAGRTLRLYDPATLALLAERPLDGKSVNAVVFGPAPGHLLAVADGADVLLWDVRDSGNPVAAGRMVTGGGEVVLGVAFAPDGKRITITSRGGELQNWDISDPSLPVPQGGLPLPLRLARYRAEYQPGGHVIAVAPAQLYNAEKVPDHVAVIASPNPTPLLLFDARDPGRVLPLRAATGKVYTFAYLPDGRLVTSGEGTVQLWKVASDGTPSAPVTMPVADPGVAVRNLATGPGGRVAGIAEDGAVYLWDAAGSAPVLTAQLRFTPANSKWLPAGQATPPLDLGFSSDGNRFGLLTPGGDAPDTLRIYNVRDTRQPGARAVVPGRAVVGPDGTRAATFEKGTIRLWDTTDPLAPRELATVTTTVKVIDGMAVAPDGRALAAYADQEVWAFAVDGAGGLRETARWHLVDGTGSCPLPGYESLPCGIDASAITFLDAGTVAVGDLTGQVSIFALNRPDGALATVPVTAGWPADLLPLAAGDKRLLVVVGRGGLNEVWDVTDPTRAVKRADLPGRDKTAGDAAADRDGRTIALVYRDGTATVWRVTADGTALHHVADRTDTGDLTAVALDPAGDRVAFLGRDRTISVFGIGDDSVTSQLLMPVGAAVDVNASLNFVGGALSLTTGSGATAVFPLDPAANARALCVGAGPPMTESQWERVAPGLPFRSPCT
ncbi:WD40 repeat domain-containing protein [Paractinoplanes durhamensis]|uniref:WD40 repeat domain-containing protein n=1 Tax=Paractinoplanes durhamensis TaxID=113563 RepID=UPI003627607B